MTACSYLRRVGAPAASAIITGGVFAGALWVQHSRGAWPFEPAVQPVVTVQTIVATATTGSNRNHDRVPIDVTSSMQQELGIRLEIVGRQSLTQDVRAVATVVPD